MKIIASYWLLFIPKYKQCPTRLRLQQLFQGKSKIYQIPIISLYSNIPELHDHKANSKNIDKTRYSVILRLHDNN